MTFALASYGSRWRRARETYLKHHPFCVFCSARGITRIATRVDHKIPHEGDSKLFWDTDNWQPLCVSCHDGVKKTMERSGDKPGVFNDGYPVDPKHHWNK